jgi:hypothetical protein
MAARARGCAGSLRLAVYAPQQQTESAIECAFSPCNASSAGEPRATSRIFLLIFDERTNLAILLEATPV